MFNTLLVESLSLLGSLKNSLKLIRRLGDDSQHCIVNTSLLESFPFPRSPMSWSKRLRSGSGTETRAAAADSGIDGERSGDRRLDQGQRARPLDDRFGTGEMLEPAGFDGFVHSGQRVLTQELQDPHKPPVAAQRAVQWLQLGAEDGEASRELPVPVHWRVVQRTGLAAQGREVMKRVEHHLAGLRGPLVGRDDLAAGHDHDPVDITLDRHQLESELPRDTVPIAIEGDGLILVHGNRRADHAGIEPMLWK